MLDDAQIRHTLLDSGLTTVEAVVAMEAHAQAVGVSLYRAAILGGVSESRLVAHVAAALEVPSVSLRNFTAKPRLSELLPEDIVRRYRVLPVGLKEHEDELTLFLAMEDPRDLDALEAVAQRCFFPISALVAGPLDLDAAIDRVYPRGLHLSGVEAYAPPPVAPQAPVLAPDDVQESTRPPASTSAAREVAPDSADIFAHMLEDIEVRGSTEMLSALSLLDDIPRNRHEVDTSPSGFSAVGRDALALSRLDAPPPRATTSSRGRSGTASSAVPSLSRTAGGFQRAGRVTEATRSLDGSDWQSVPTARLLRAVVRILLRRGVITRAELDAALDEP